MEPEINLALVIELLVLTVNVLELDRNLLLSLFVDSLPDLAEGTTAQLPLKTIMLCHYSVLHFRLLLCLN